MVENTSSGPEWNTHSLSHLTQQQLIRKKIIVCFPTLSCMFVWLLYVCKHCVDCLCCTVCLITLGLDFIVHICQHCVETRKEGKTGLVFILLYFSLYTDKSHTKPKWQISKVGRPEWRPATKEGWTWLSIGREALIGREGGNCFSRSTKNSFTISLRDAVPAFLDCVAVVENKIPRIN